MLTPAHGYTADPELIAEHHRLAAMWGPEQDRALDRARRNRPAPITRAGYEPRSHSSRPSPRRSPVCPRALKATDALAELYCGNAPARAAELPPHDLSAEIVVLSAVLWGDRTTAQLGLRARWLWATEHRWIWAAVATLEELRPAYTYELRMAAAVRVLPDLCAPRLEWYWHRRLLQISGYGGAVEECVRIVRDKARERALLQRMAQIERDLRSGDPPDWRVVTDTVAGLLRMRQEHRRQEIRDARRGRRGVRPDRRMAARP